MIEGTLKLAPPLTVYLLSIESLRNQTIWEEVATFIRGDLEYVLNGSMTLGDVRERALDGVLAIWVAKDRKLRAVAFVEVWPAPRTKVCHILGLIGKRMDKWIDGLAEIEKWAKSKGCTKMHIEGRSSWMRVLQDYDATGVVLEKKL